MEVIIFHRWVDDVIRSVLYWDLQSKHMTANFTWFVVYHFVFTGVILDNATLAVIKKNKKLWDEYG